MRNLLESKALSKIDLNKQADKIDFYNFWCRTVNTKYEKWNVKEHLHSFFELHICLKGFTKIVIEGRELCLKEKEYIILPPKTHHKIIFESQDFCKFIWGFSIKENEVFSQKVENYFSEVKIQITTDDMLQSVFLALEYAESKAYGAFRVIKDSLFRIFSILIKGIESLNVECKIPQKHGKEYYELIRNYIKENLSNGVTLEQVSFFFRMSKNKINEICIKESGESFRTMKSKIQLSVIRELLGSGETSIEQIASKTGFSDRYAMSKFFKKNEGINPGEYRLAINK